MKSNQPAQNNIPAFFSIYQSVLYVLLIGLSFSHMLVSAFRYVIDMKVIVKPETVFALIIAGLTVIYLIISKIHDFSYPDKIRPLFSRIFTYEQLSLLFIAVWFAISFQINQKRFANNLYFKNQWELLHFFIIALVIFPIAAMLRNNARKIIEWQLMAVLFCYSCFTIYGLWHIFRLDSVRMPSGNKISILNDPMALQLSSHYNTTAEFAFLMLILSLYFMTHRNKAVKIISFILFFVHLFTCQLSNSRTVYVTGLIILPLSLFFCAWNRFDNRDARFRTAAGLLAAASGFFLYRFSRAFSFYLFEKITHYNEIILNAEDGLSKSMDNIRELEANLNGRRNIWIHSLKTMVHDPVTFLFGVTPMGVSSALIDFGGYSKEVAHAHNAVLQIGICFGVPAMIAYSIFLIRVCLRSLQILFIHRQSDFRFAFFIPIMVFSLVLQGIPEPLIVNLTIMSSILHLFAGWEIEITERKNDETIKGTAAEEAEAVPEEKMTGA